MTAETKQEDERVWMRIISKRRRAGDPDGTLSAHDGVEREQNEKRRQAFRPGENRLRKIKWRRSQEEQARYKQITGSMGCDDQRGAEKNERVENDPDRKELAKTGPIHEHP